MNIFYLDKNIKKCAQYHCDKHVVKMILEYAQILCTVLHKTKESASLHSTVKSASIPYRATHKNHPCVLWAGESLANWKWLRDLACALNDEYKFRFDKTVNHKSYDIILTLPIPKIPNIGLTERPQTMPEEFRIHHDPITAYRNYYMKGKTNILYWKKRETPAWCSIQ